MIKMNVWRRKPGTPSEGSAVAGQVDPELQVAMAGGIALTREIDVLIGVARESSDFRTKRARLAGAKQKLSELKLLASAHARLTIPRLGEVESAVARIERESRDWRYEPNGPFPQWTPREITSHSEHADYTMAAWRANQDIIECLQFCATMSSSTPLKALRRHGELHTDITCDLPQIIDNWSQGVWVQKLRSFRSMGIDMDEPGPGMMASQMGPIPLDGGEFLRFLIMVREIVESGLPIEARAARLLAELKRTFWCKFVSALGGDPVEIVCEFFPYAVDTIPGLTMSARDVLARLGLDTAAKVAATLDIDLLDIKGIGPAKLKAIREWQIQVAEPNATRFDRVVR